MAEQKDCICGKTKNANGKCDGSHAANGVEKSIPFNKVTIRVLSTKEPQKAKNLYAFIANNKALMKRMEFVISDPNYEEKMKAITEKKPYFEKSTASKKLATA